MLYQPPFLYIKVCTTISLQSLLPCCNDTLRFWTAFVLSLISGVRRLSSQGCCCMCCELAKIHASSTCIHVSSISTAKQLWLNAIKSHGAYQKYLSILLLQVQVDIHFCFTLLQSTTGLINKGWLLLIFMPYFCWICRWNSALQCHFDPLPLLFLLSF